MSVTLLEILYVRHESSLCNRKTREMLKLSFKVTFSNCWGSFLNVILSLLFQESLLFPTKIATKQQSVVLVKRLLAISVSCITYLRGLFPESSYGTRYLDGNPCNLFRILIHTHCIHQNETCYSLFDQLSTPQIIFQLLMYVWLEFVGRVANGLYQVLMQIVLLHQMESTEDGLELLATRGFPFHVSFGL